MLRRKHLCCLLLVLGPNLVLANDTYSNRVPAPALQPCDPVLGYNHCLRVVTHINATTETVWNIAARVSNLPEFFPEVDYVSSATGVIFQTGDRYTVTHTSFGIAGDYEFLAVVPYRRMLGKQTSPKPLAAFMFDHKYSVTVTGVLSDETIHYSLPLGFIGRILNAFVAKRRLRKALLYSHRKLQTMAPNQSTVDD